VSDVPHEMQLTKPGSRQTQPQAAALTQHLHTLVQKVP